MTVSDNLHAPGGALSSATRITVSAATARAALFFSASAMLSRVSLSVCVSIDKYACALFADGVGWAAREEKELLLPVRRDERAI